MQSPESISNLKHAASITIAFLEPVLYSIEQQLKDVLEMKKINSEQQKKYINKIMRDIQNSFPYPIKGLDDTFSLLDSKYVMGQYQHNQDLKQEHFDILTDKLQLRSIIIALENMRDGVTPDVRFMWDDQLIVIQSLDMLFDLLASIGLQGFVTLIEDQLLHAYSKVSDAELEKTKHAIMFQGMCQKANESLIIPQIHYWEKQLSFDLHPGCINLIYEVYLYLVDISIKRFSDLLENIDDPTEQVITDLTTKIKSYEAIRDGLLADKEKQIKQGTVINKLLGPIVHLASSLDNAIRYGTPVHFFGTHYENAEEIYELCKVLVKKYNFGSHGLSSNRVILNELRKYLLSFKE